MTETTLLTERQAASLEGQMEEEARAIAHSGRSAGREGIAAFLAKHSPRFTGA